MASRVALFVAAWIIVAGSIRDPEFLAASEDGDLCGAIRRAYLANLSEIAGDAHDHAALAGTKFMFRESRQTLERELMPMAEICTEKMLCRLETPVRPRSPDNQTRVLDDGDDLAVAGLWRDTLGLIVLPIDLTVYVCLGDVRRTLRLLEGTVSSSPPIKEASDIPRPAVVFLARYIASYQLLARRDMTGDKWTELTLEEVAWRRTRWEILSFLRACRPASEHGLDCHLAFLRISTNREGSPSFPCGDEARRILLALTAQLSSGRRQWREVLHWIEGLSEMPVYEQFNLPEGGAGYAFRPPLPGPPSWSGSFGRAVSEVAGTVSARDYRVVPGVFGRAIAGFSLSQCRPLRADGVWILCRAQTSVEAWSRLRLNSDEWLRIDVVDLFQEDALSRRVMLRELREQPLKRVEADDPSMRWRPEVTARCWSSADLPDCEVEMRRVRWQLSDGRQCGALTALRGSLRIEVRFKVREGSGLASSLSETILRVVKSVDEHMVMALREAKLL